MCKPEVCVVHRLPKVDDSKEDPKSSSTQVSQANDPACQQVLLVKESLKNAKENLRKGTLYACISLTMLISAFSLLMPYLQSQRDELKCDTLCQGSMTSVRSALTLVGSALMGRLSDTQMSTRTAGQRHTLWFLHRGNGRILCLMIGTLATLLGFVINASMYSIKGMWFGMIPGALLQQNFSVYKAILADYHEDITRLERLLLDAQQKAQRNQSTSEGVVEITSTNSNTQASSVGQLGMSLGIAFMLGPLFGAMLVKTYQSAIVISSCLTILSAIWIIKVPIPSNISSSLDTNTMTVSKSENGTKTNGTSWISSLKQKLMNVINVKSATSKSAILFIILRMSMALAFHIFNTIWTASLKRRFDFGPKDHGKFMSFIGLVYALSQGFIAKRILAPFGNHHSGRVKVIMCCCVALGVGRVIAFHVEDLRIVYVMFGLIVTSLGVVNTIFTADTSLIAPSSEIGGVYGILEAAQSAAGMVGPFVGGLLTRIDPIVAPLSVVVGLYVFVFILVLGWYEKLILTNIKGEPKVVPSKTSKKDV